MFLSIIVPCYNLEKWIGECLESLCQQNIEKGDYEIICVDDGSSDNTLEVIYEYQKNIENIVILQKENGGVSSARNLGLEHAKGEYIWFVDGDDYINSNCLKFIKDSILENKADILHLKFERKAEDLKFVIKDNKYELDKETSGYEYNESPGVVVKKCIIFENNLMFDTTLNYAEDNVWRYSIARIVKKQISCGIPIYNYRQRQSSAMNVRSKESIERHINSMARLIEIYEKLKLNGDEENLDVLIRYATEGILMDLIMLNDKKVRDEYLLSLSEKNLYPYKPIYHHLKVKKDLKDNVRRWMLYSFPIKIYYVFIYNVLSKIVGLKIKN